MEREAQKEEATLSFPNERILNIFCCRFETWPQGPLFVRSSQESSAAGSSLSPAVLRFTAKGRCCLEFHRRDTKLKVGGKKINEGEIISSARLSTSGNVFQLKRQTQTIIIHGLPLSELGWRKGPAGPSLLKYFKELPAPWKEMPQIDLRKKREWGLSRCSEPFFFINISVHFPLPSMSLQAISTLFLLPTRSGLGAYPASPPSR